MILTVSMLAVGLLCAMLLFARTPRLEKSGADARRAVSVVIPARNEEKTLPLILADLAKQKDDLLETIVVDDGSSDNTYAVAESFGCKTLRVTDKPAGWTGKSFACQTGADAAQGSLLLFLDADVRLSPGAVAGLRNSWAKNQRTVSVCPYHRTGRPVESLSLFFNLLMVAAQRAEPFLQPPQHRPFRAGHPHQQRRLRRRQRPCRGQGEHCRRPGARRAAENKGPRFRPVRRRR